MHHGYFSLIASHFDVKLRYIFRNTRSTIADKAKKYIRFIFPLYAF